MLLTWLLLKLGVIMPHHGVPLSYQNWAITKPDRTPKQPKRAPEQETYWEVPFSPLDLFFWQVESCPPYCIGKMSFARSGNVNYGVFLVAPSTNIIIQFYWSPLTHCIYSFQKYGSIVCPDGHVQFKWPHDMMYWCGTVVSTVNHFWVPHCYSEMMKDL